MVRTVPRVMEAQQQTGSWPVVSSRRAKCSLVTLVAGYLASAVVAGAPNSPLTVLLPSGVQPPSWASTLARVSGLDHVGRKALIGVAWVVLLVVLAAFATVVREALRHRIRLVDVLIASGVSLAIAVAAPLLLSRDVYTYAAYGRIHALYHRNPYVVPLWSFRNDPFIAVASAQWRHQHSFYGPVFTLLSSVIARTWKDSPATTILAFKVLSGVAVASATALVALTAARIRPERAALAVVLIGLNPVIVIHTVGGAHIDALIAAPLAAAMALAVCRPRSLSFAAIGVTALLVGACLLKTVMAPALVLWIWWLVRTDRSRRSPILFVHLAVVAGLVLASVRPFVAGSRTLAAVASLGGQEQWASPSQLVGRAAHAFFGALAGDTVGAVAATVVRLAFLLLFVLLLWRVSRRLTPDNPTALASAWGTALLLLPLCMPYFLPWYAAWFVPFLAIISDDVLVVAGVVVSAALALTLVPADPFHGYSTPGVMNGVHFGAASVLLVVLIVVVGRLFGSSLGQRRWATSPAPGSEHEVETVSRA